MVPAPALVLAAIASVQIGAALAKQLFATAGPGGTVLLRLTLAAALLLALARPSLAGISPDHRRLTILFGLVLGGMNFAFYEAVDRIPLGAAVTVEFLGPLTVAVFGSRRLLDALWVVLAGAGVVALTEGGSGRLAPAGVVLAAVAGVCWAGYILLGSRLGAAFPGNVGLALGCAVGAVAVAPYGIIDGGTALLRPEVLAAGLGVAVLSSAVPYSLEIAALRRMPTAVFGVLMSVEPAMAALAAFVILGERLAPRQLAGIVLVCLASAGATLSRRRRG
ncbi:MAG: EamA family transporter [Frankiaceae bacterium]